MELFQPPIGLSMRSVDGHRLYGFIPTVHYPWPFVSPQLLNTKGEEIYFPVVDDKDRCWARRLEWAIDRHRDLDEAELNGLQAHFEKVLRRSRDHHQLYIKSLQEQLESAHKRLRELRRP